MKEKQTNYETHGATANQKKLWLFLLLFLGLSCQSFLFGFAAAAPPESSTEEVEPCLVYAYTSSGQHHFLAVNESYVYGSQLTIHHSCDYVRVSNESGFMANSSKSRFDLPLLYGIHNLTFETNTHSQSIENLSFIPDRFTWLDEYNLLVDQKPQGEWVFIEEVKDRENLAVFVSGVLSLALIFGFYWRVIEHYLDHNHIEERRG
jgi:hypothetical protein